MNVIKIGFKELLNSFKLELGGRQTELKTIFFVLLVISIERISLSLLEILSNSFLNDNQREKTQKRLTTNIFKNQILAASNYIIVYTIS